MNDAAVADRPKKTLLAAVSVFAVSGVESGVTPDAFWVVVTLDLPRKADRRVVDSSLRTSPPPVQSWVCYAAAISSRIEVIFADRSAEMGEEPAAEADFA
ncbi:hypothetical protein GCM10025873_17630 [Demequina sediminis]|nr:hypothetical protein GCM10025873_17630 [Demequina sediminis]